MIRSGLQHPLEMEDLGKPSSALDVEALREKFRVEWDNGNRSLLMGVDSRNIAADVDCVDCVLHDWNSDDLHSLHDSGGLAERIWKGKPK